MTCENEQINFSIKYELFRKMLSMLRVATEGVTCFGSGVLGLTTVVMKGNIGNISRYVGFTAVSAGIFYTIIRQKSKRAVSNKSVVLITGCDSGLG